MPVLGNVAPVMENGPWRSAVDKGERGGTSVDDEESDCNEGLRDDGLHNEVAVNADVIEEEMIAGGELCVECCPTA